MKLTRDDLKWPQIDAAFKYIYDNPNKYNYRKRNGIPLTDCYEFGVYNGGSLRKICDYLKSNDFVGIPNLYAHGFDSFEGLPEEAEGVQLFEKFKQGSYKTKMSPSGIKMWTDYHNLIINKCWFHELDETHAGKPALLVHIDCDLYYSTKQALEFLIKYKLIATNTLIAYDEFESTDRPKLSGERRAHEEFFGEYREFQADEIWHNVYFDKSTGQRIRQSVFEVL